MLQVERRIKRRVQEVVVLGGHSAGAIKETDIEDGTAECDMEGVVSEWTGSEWRRAMSGNCGPLLAQPD